MNNDRWHTPSRWPDNPALAIELAIVDIEFCEAMGAVMYDRPVASPHKYTVWSLVPVRKAAERVLERERTGEIK